VHEAQRASRDENPCIAQCVGDRRDKLGIESCKTGCVAKLGIVPKHGDALCKTNAWIAQSS
jgi:hypothetical protein